jgi:hypothetical protein
VDEELRVVGLIKVNLLEREADAASEGLDLLSGNATGDEEWLPKSTVIDKHRMLGGVASDVIAQVGGVIDGFEKWLSCCKMRSFARR